MTTLPVTHGDFIPASDATTQAACEPVICRTSRGLLLAIYSIIPLCLLTVGIDQLFFGGWLKAHLPRSPEDLFLFIIFFNMPHIVSSTVIFADHGYLKHYGKSLLAPAIILAGIALFFPAVLYSKAFVVFYALWAILHFTGQQAGMARTMGPLSKRIHSFWRWMVLLISIPLNFDMFSVVKMSHEAHHELLIFIVAALAAFLFVSFLLCRTAESKIAQYYVVANAVGVATGVALFSIGYYFFVILISRVIHDLSAYTFYISHDANRNAVAMKNLFYRSLRFLRLPVYAMCPLLGIVIGFPFTYYLNHDLAYRIWLPITLMHYYTDGLVWKKGSLHRAYIHMR